MLCNETAVFLHDAHMTLSIYTWIMESEQYNYVARTFAIDQVHLLLP